jgi:glycosyltransferase involved in cell wall biosynthesis
MLSNYLGHVTHVTTWGFQPLYPRWLFPGNTTADPSQQAIPCQVDYWLHGYQPLTWWQALRRMPDDVEVVVWQWWTPYWIPFLMLLSWQLKRKRLRQIAVCHQLVEPDAAAWQVWLATWMLGHADGVIFLGDERTPPSGWPTPHRHVVLPAHDALWESLPSRTDARHHLGIASDVPVALCFGFVRPYKGLTVVVDALALTTQPCLLVIAGEWWPDAAPLRTHIANSSAQARMVIHDHYIPNEHVGAYFAACDVVLLPHRSGNVSGVATLAALSGRPVITSTTGAIGGEATVYATVDRAEPAAWAAALDDFCRQQPRPTASPVRPHTSWVALYNALQELAHAHTP